MVSISLFAFFMKEKRELFCIQKIHLYKKECVDFPEEKVSLCQNVRTIPSRMARKEAGTGTGGDTRISGACGNAK